MAQRGILPVLQYRGNIRRLLRRAQHYLETLLRYDERHPGNTVFTDPQTVKIVEVKALVTASLARRVKV